jgi:hypothetical protein
MIDLLDNMFKKHILDNWTEEVVYNQRTMLDLMKWLHWIRWYDEQVWEKIIDTTIQKRKINAFKDFQMVHNTLCYMNEDHENCPLAGTLGEKIEQFMNKHYTEDRKWKYCDKRRIEKPISEIIARREVAVFENYSQGKGETDQRIVA